MNKKNNSSAYKVVADNRKARFNYEILDTLEAGVVLQGTEVKSLRAHHGNIAESYASFENGEFWLINSYIMSRWANAVAREGMTIVPLKLYFNERGRVKLEIALARGKKIHDKRETEKKRDWNREKSRLMRERG